MFLGLCSDVSEVHRICIIAHKIPERVGKFTCTSMEKKAISRTLHTHERTNARAGAYTQNNTHGKKIEIKMIINSLFVIPYPSTLWCTFSNFGGV